MFINTPPAVIFLGVGIDNLLSFWCLAIHNLVLVLMTRIETTQPAVLLEPTYANPAVIGGGGGGG